MIARELQSYRKTYELVKMVVEAAKEYNKQFKYTLGSKTIDEALLLFEYIQRANMFKENRAMYLNGFIVKFETVKTFLRLADDFKQLSNNRKVKMFECMEDIGRQITAWKRSPVKNGGLQREPAIRNGEPGESFQR